MWTVPDARLDNWAQIAGSKQIIHADDLVDIAGLVKGASKGEGLGANSFWANIAGRCHCPRPAAA